MTDAFELGPQHTEIVDLPIEDEPDTTVLVSHRLRASVGQIDDRQPSMSKCYPSTFQKSCAPVIRPRVAIVSSILRRCSPRAVAVAD